MSIAGIGSDIVRIERIRQVLQRHPERFVARVLTEEERCALTRQRDSAAFVAKRFAAKEAAAKALGVGIAEGVSFTDFNVAHTAAGQPLLEVRGRARRLMDQARIERAHLSLSDESEYALAFVVLEREGHAS